MKINILTYIHTHIVPKDLDIGISVGLILIF